MTGHVTIDVLPDDILLEVFDCYLGRTPYVAEMDEWHTLVHVSRKWRCVVFNSPCRLNLRLVCSARTPVREMLTIWPPLPIVICEYNPSQFNEDNIIAALEQHDRVCRFELYGVSSSLLEKLLTAMQEPFPALAYLKLVTWDDMAPVIPDSFLGGFAPKLDGLRLTRIPIPPPVLRKLLLSTTNLVELSLPKILYSEYFSPEAMVTCLSALTRLKYLNFGFKFRRSRIYWENRRPPPPTRTLLPALRHLVFTGVSEYLEGLVARIDAPLLDSLTMAFFHQLIFDTPQLSQFISHSGRRQKDEAHSVARVIFSDSRVTVSLPGRFPFGLSLEISCRQSDWQLSAVAQVCSSSFPQAFIQAVEYLYILEEGPSQLCWQDDIENSQWLELLHPFTGVKNLFLSHKSETRIAPALQELVGERIDEVLPALQSIHLDQRSGLVPMAIGRFVTARHFSSHPIAMVPWTGY